MRKVRIITENVR